MTETTLSDRHRLFIAAYIADPSPARAAIAVGYSPRSAVRSGARMLAIPEVRAAIDAHQASIATAAKISVASLVIEAERAREVAESSDHPSAMVAAITLKARLTGLLSDKAIDDRDERSQVQRAELRTASGLLRDAAVSLGLPADASPAQIVGAVSLRPIAPPEAFALLRGAVDVDDE